VQNKADGYEIDNPFSLAGVLKDNALGERLFSKFHSCPRSFASRPTVHFSDIMYDWIS